MPRPITYLGLPTRQTAGLACLFFGLFASPAFSASSIQLTWIASPEPDLMGYYVYMGTSQGSYHITKNVGLNTSYIFQNLPEGLTYYFTITAYDHSGNISAPAEEMGITVPIRTTNPNPPRNQDLNGDGKADLVLRNTKTGEVAVWLLSGTSGVTSGILGQLPMEWALRGVGDVNGDGVADLVWRNDMSGAVAVWLMNGLTITATGFPGSAPSDWAIQAVGDVDGDGRADLVWRNRTDGNTAIWLMNGTA
ncbi:MAG: FG-GAP repeat protein, partial [Nitrospira sp.]|nr:FG-GAP repeat protein [Nitrospira sp.]